MNWTNIIENAIPVFTICGVFFAWLRYDMKRMEERLTEQIKQVRDDMKEGDRLLRDDMKEGDRLLRDDMNARFEDLNVRLDSLEARLRAVESEQSRVVGLLQGLALDRSPAMAGRDE